MPHEPAKEQNLVGLSEIAQMLGVSRQRAFVLTEREGFPAPQARLRSSGPVWRTQEVKRWIAKHRGK